MDAGDGASVGRMISRRAWPCDRRSSRVAIMEAGLAVWRRTSETLEHELDHAFTAMRFDERYAHVASRLCRVDGEPPAL
ncbi:hypothetical protein [Streptomyces albogriseolus]|uniref:hypothetical protein n=1 Tax=Streptomyces albogriseolus TaxID=1887 RepID=UPI0036FB2074